VFDVHSSSSLPSSSYSEAVSSISTAGRERGAGAGCCASLLLSEKTAKVRLGFGLGTGAGACANVSSVTKTSWRTEEYDEDLPLALSREDARSEEFRIVVLTVVVVFLSLSFRSDIFLRSLSFSGKYGTASSYIFRAEKFSPLAACCSVFILFC